MAAEADALAALGAFLNVLSDRMASRRFVNFITLQELDDGLLQKLKDAMESVQGVLDEAEEKDITKPAVKKWLDNLKNAFFEVDDLLDEIDYEATRLESEAESRSVNDGFNEFLSPRKSFENGLRKILETIEHLVKQKDDEKLEIIEHLVKQKEEHGLRENIGGGQSTQRIPTTSVVDTSDICVRVRDQEELIMEVLLSDDVNRSNKLRIISIVGLGGIGKTTLAKFIYNDERVRIRFGVRGWVWVSEKFDVLGITGAIATELAQMALKHKTHNQIQVELMEKLTGKRLLLVLDDVWNENVSYWEQVLTPLKSAGPGSTIIITTRNDVVAKTVRSESMFRLGKLDSTESWQLFCKYAFVDQNSPDYPRFEEIGKEIVKRCDGLPLAVKAMGGALGIRKDVKFWGRVLKNDLWKCSKDGILPVLRLSYRYLPLHIKQCFAYCSIFSKNYRFQKKQLILLWMAEGFLTEQDGYETMEEVGEEYFEELVSRSFFQHDDNDNSFGDFFIMHDLINDLARVVAGDFCLRFENHDFCRTFDKLRYFSCLAGTEPSSQQLSSIFKSRLLRTFLPFHVPWKEQGQKLLEMIPDLFLNQQRLRVLSLFNCEKVVKLPTSIRHLEKHLRYLNLSRTFITSLPECLCSFYNLQTLNLSSCKNLAKLPTKMGRLINMRHLDIQFTKLQETPPNMGKLIKLQTLTDFFVRKREGCGVEELGSLRQLGGRLKIRNLKHVVNANDAFDAKIKCKKNLKELCLYWEAAESDPRHPEVEDDPPHDEAVLDGLEPPTEIELISIVAYGGNRFPYWLESGSFPCLKELWVMNCPNLKGALQSHFPSLRILEFRGCPQLQNCFPHAPNLSFLQVYREFRGPAILHYNSHHTLDYSFSSLSICGFHGCILENIGQLGSSLQHITIEKQESLKCFLLELFPKLESLTIKECPHFESFCTPTQEFASFEFLTKIILKDCPELKFLPERMHSLFPALLTLEIITCPEIERFSGDGLPSNLHSLAISNCNKLIARRMNWDLQKLTSLTSLSIHDYEAEEMESFPEVALLPSTLTSLEIYNLPYLKSLNYEGLHSLERLEIRDCPRFQLVPDEGLPSTLTHLNRRFHNFTSLKELDVWGCPEIVSLLRLPPNLISLSLFDLENLRSMEGLRHLTSLESLSISSCPHLETLPEEGWPSALSSLEIGWCPSLEERYKREEGECWANISHIPSIEIISSYRN